MGRPAARLAKVAVLAAAVGTKAHRAGLLRADRADRRDGLRYHPACSPLLRARRAGGEPIGVHQRGGGMTEYTLAQAIAATGHSRSALIRAIRGGKLSASRDASGAYLVDPAELARVYGSGS